MLEAVGIVSVLFALALLFIVLRRVLRMALRLALIGLIVILTIGAILYYRMAYVGGSDAANRNAPSATSAPRRTAR